MLYHPEDITTVASIETSEDSTIEISSSLNSENYMLTISKDLMEFSIVLTPADIIDLAHALADIEEELQ